MTDKPISPLRQGGTDMHLPAKATLLPAASETPDFALDDLRVFHSIPDNSHDVVSLLGMVVVYETDTLARDGLIDGALYVIEDQRPVGGMNWETCDRLNRERGPGQPRYRIKTRRRVIRAVKHPNDPCAWFHLQPGGYPDGPIYDWAVADNFVGRVVGIYKTEAA